LFGSHRRRHQVNYAESDDDDDNDDASSNTTQPLSDDSDEDAGSGDDEEWGDDDDDDDVRGKGTSKAKKASAPKVPWAHSLPMVVELVES
jgi:hypothetical protein